MRRVAVVMAGGSGERFWPLSTPDLPKQLLDLTGSGKPLLAEAIDRVRPVVDEVFVSTTARLAPTIVASGLVSAANVLAEPCKRNTAGALVWSMAHLRHLLGDEFLCAITTADHSITPETAFQACAQEALDLAKHRGALVTIGIPPTRPETGYGYLETGPDSRVVRFTEKPALARAEGFLAAGNYLWNSGMFFWRSDVFADQLRIASPAHRAAYDGMTAALAQGDGAGAEAALEALPDQSIDYALMERSDQVAYVRASFEWDDVGSWSSLLRTVPLDENGNAAVGEVVAIRCRGCVLYNASRIPLCAIGMEDCVVVATPDATLTLPLAEVQNVREVSRKLAT